MAGVEPYSPCPCGSGQKFKWCCQKIEAYADKAQRLYEGGQVDAALQALDEGLRKAPANPWLSSRKAMILIEEDRAAEALTALDSVVASHPKHLGAQALLIRAVLMAEGAVAAVGQLQQAFTALPREQRLSLSPLVQLIGVSLIQAEKIPAAIAHLHLWERIVPTDDPMIPAIADRIESDPEISPWLRDTYRLSPHPDGLDPDRAARFQDAIHWAEDGLWSASAAAFSTLATDDSLPEADRNLAIIRLWLADEEAAAEALGRYVDMAGDRPDAVDMESLRQLLAPIADEDQLDAMQLTWPIRDRIRLLAALDDDPKSMAVGSEPIDPENPQSPTVDRYWLLDRPTVEPSAVRGPSDIPRVVGEVSIGADTVLLHGVDDGGLDALGDRFTSLAGASIPPAHPKTKRVGKVARSLYRIDERWAVPRGLEPQTLLNLIREDLPRLLRQVWAKTPMPYLGGRTPEKAARDGDAMVPLRAALNIIEFDRTAMDGPAITSAIRGELGIPAEPAIDPASVNVNQVALGRLHALPIDQLDDSRLKQVYQRARTLRLALALERAASEITRRPAINGEGGEPGVDRVALFSDLAMIAVSRRNFDRARELARSGRDNENPAHRTAHTPGWDVLDLRIAIEASPPEQWVPDLVILLDRYRENPAANEQIMGLLIDLGLLRMVPDPESRRGGMLVDPRPLQALIERYGPRITTASGRLGVAEASGGIWTPDKEAASRGGSSIWTPGSGNPQPSDPNRPDTPPSKLIITGS